METILLEIILVPIVMTIFYGDRNMMTIMMTIKTTTTTMLMMVIVIMIMIMMMMRLMVVVITRGFYSMEIDDRLGQY